jgi:hypothetical protein
MFQFAVIPGAAKRRPGIQSAAETLLIPAFAGMTKKNSIIKIQAVKNAPCVMYVQRPAQREGRAQQSMNRSWWLLMKGETTFADFKDNGAERICFCRF